MLRDEKAGTAKLDTDLDEYFKNKPEITENVNKDTVAATDTNEKEE